MLYYLENPYVFTVSTVVGAFLVVLLFTFVTKGSGEPGNISQRFILPCMINPATLDTEDEDEQVPHEDQRQKGRSDENIGNERKANQGDEKTLEAENDDDLEKFIESQEGIIRDSCIKVSPALQAEYKIKSSLSEEELLNEREIQQQQLAAIFDLMKKQSDKFGDTSMDEIEQQMKIYR